MLYLADNLAYIPYTVVDEPLFLIHHIDIMVSVIGCNILQVINIGGEASWSFFFAPEHQGELATACRVRGEDEHGDRQGGGGVRRGLGRGQEQCVQQASP